MTDTPVNARLAPAEYKSFAVLHKTRGFTHVVKEIVEVSDFDPYKVLQSQPGDLIAFTFYRRLTTVATLEGETHEVHSDWLTPDGGLRFFYLVDPQKISTRKSLTRFWQTNWRDFEKLNAMYRRGSDHVAIWKHGIYFGYNPKLDVILNR